LSGLRLCYVVTHPMTTRFLRGQLAFMRACGYEVTLVASPGEELESCRVREHVDTRCVPMEREFHPLRDLRSLVHLYRVFRSLRPHIVNAGTPKAGLLGMLAAALARVPVRVYTLHGLRLETTSGVKRAILAITERLASRLATRVVCVSESLRTSYLRHGLAPASKLRVLGSGSCNGLNVASFAVPHSSEFNSRRRATRQTLGIPEGSPVLGAVGRLTNDKGLVDLLDVFDRVRCRFPDARLLLIGDFEPGDPLPEACVSRIKTDERIHWTGPVDDVVRYYPAMNVLLHASRREGFPYVPLEAAAAGLPVVGYRVTGVVDAIRDNATGFLVPPGDKAGFAQSVCRYLQSPRFAQQHGEAGRERVLKDFSQPRVWQRLVREYYRLLRAKHVSAPDTTDEHAGRISPVGENLSQSAPRPTEPGRHRRNSFYSSIGKRQLDLAVAIPALVVLSPLLLSVAGLVRWRLGGPVLFWQQRPGLRGRPFWMAKFRTMTDARDASGELLPDAQRLTPYGRWLRSTSLDELPELWNVLRGDMSLVGPRPLLMEYLDRYSPEQARRHEVKPGISGLAQVRGRNAISWEEKFRHDLSYVQNHSLSLDVRILLQTVIAVISRRGVRAENHATMPRFGGPTLQRSCHDQAA
jgi:lipopolysaccharide/colanic/teichoic acid biosynthesis glycosyltransferase/glycosyltransferase involved in cell wall biosynthesis